MGGGGGAKEFSAQFSEVLSVSEMGRPRGKTSSRRDKRIPPSNLYSGVMALYASRLWKFNQRTGPKNEAQVGRSDRGVQCNGWGLFQLCHSVKRQPRGSARWGRQIGRSPSDLQYPVYFMGDEGLI